MTPGKKGKVAAAVAQEQQQQQQPLHGTPAADQEYASWWARAQVR